MDSNYTEWVIKTFSIAFEDEEKPSYTGSASWTLLFQKNTATKYLQQIHTVLIFLEIIPKHCLICTIIKKHFTLEKVLNTV